MEGARARGSRSWAFTEQGTEREVEDQRHVVTFPEDHMRRDEIQILLRQLVANVVGLHRERVRLAALRAKGRDADATSTWRQDVHRSEIEIALQRLREVGGLSTDASHARAAD